MKKTCIDGRAPKKSEYGQHNHTLSQTKIKRKWNNSYSKKKKNYKKLTPKEKKITEKNLINIRNRSKDNPTEKSNQT